MRLSEMVAKAQEVQREILDSATLSYHARGMATRHARSIVTDVLAGVRPATETVETLRDANGTMQRERDRRKMLRSERDCTARSIGLRLIHGDTL